MEHNAYKLAQELEQIAESQKILNDRKYEIEKILIEICGTKEEGSKTTKINNLSMTSTTKKTRSVSSKITELKDVIPEALYNRVITFKPSLNLSEYRYVMNNEPEYFKLLSKYVTEKDAKPSIKVKIL